MTRLHIHHTPAVEVSRERQGHDRWCYHCRAIRAFEVATTEPICEPGNEPGCWYGSDRRIECATCHTVDSDLFPGRAREWDQ